MIKQKYVLEPYIEQNSMDNHHYNYTNDVVGFTNYRHHDTLLHTHIQPQPYNRKFHKTTSGGGNCKLHCLLDSFCRTLIISLLLVIYTPTSNANSTISATNAATVTLVVQGMDFPPQQTPTDLPIQNKFPQYWTMFRNWVRVTNTFQSFWQKYAYCIEYQWYTGCEQYRRAAHVTYNLKEYMLDMSINETNLDEQNPLKCHWIEAWANKTNNMAIYSTHWKSFTNIKTQTLKVNNIYKTMTITLPEDDKKIPC